MTNRLAAFIAFALALACLAPAPAFAWGEYGHRTIAAIAEDNMSPAARAEMARLLRSAPSLGTPQCDLETIGDASVWADCVRRDRLRWGHTFPWHYQNVNVCEPFTLEGKCPFGNCAYAQVARNFALLKDDALPAPVRLEAFAFLVHFTGDLHMPLHAGDRADRGGNDLKAHYGIIPGLNLHWIWDSHLAERSISAAPSLVRRYSASERADMNGGDPESWSREAWELSRTLAYGRALDGDPCGPVPEAPVTIDEADVAASREALRLQIARAGLRLARMLDEALVRKARD